MYFKVCTVLYLSRDVQLYIKTCTPLKAHKYNRFPSNSAQANMKLILIKMVTTFVFSVLILLVLASGDLDGLLVLAFSLSLLRCYTLYSIETEPLLYQSQFFFDISYPDVWFVPFSALACSSYYLTSGMQQFRAKYIQRNHQGMFLFMTPTHNSPDPQPNLYIYLVKNAKRIILRFVNNLLTKLTFINTWTWRSDITKPMSECLWTIVLLLLFSILYVFEFTFYCITGSVPTPASQSYWY